MKMAFIQLNIMSESLLRNINAIIPVYSDPL